MFAKIAVRCPIAFSADSSLVHLGASANVIRTLNCDTPERMWLGLRAYRWFRSVYMRLDEPDWVSHADIIILDAYTFEISYRPLGSETLKHLHLHSPAIAYSNFDLGAA